MGAELATTERLTLSLCFRGGYTVWLKFPNQPPKLLYAHGPHFQGPVRVPSNVSSRSYSFENLEEERNSIS